MFRFKLIEIVSSAMILLTISVFSFSAFAQDNAWIHQKPVDEEDAQQVRIWLGLERSQNCRTVVTIVDSKMDTVRNLFSKMMSRGYFNYYWDKRDDSGNFVPEGNYHYIVKDCVYHKPGKLKVQYKRYERSCELDVERFTQDSTITLNVLEDSLKLSLVYENRRSDVVYEPLLDTILNTGEHIVPWIPPKELQPGRYSARLTIGDFVINKRVVLKR